MFDVKQLMMPVYFGGSSVLSLLVDTSMLVSALVGVLAWGGLFLRDKRVRELIFTRR
jgi:hypothetical protein